MSESKWSNQPDLPEKSPWLPAVGKGGKGWPDKSSDCESSGYKIADGPLCGVELYIRCGELSYYDADSGCWLPLPEGTPIERCLVADVVECCTDPVPQRWCANLDALGGNGNSASEYQINVGGNDVLLPPNWTTADIIAALQAGGGSYVIDSDGSVCSTDGPFSVSLSGSVATGTAPDIVYSPYLVTRPALMRPEIPGQCFKVSVTKDINSDPMLAAMNAQLQATLQLNETIRCQAQPTGWIITSGPLCNLPVFTIKGECVIFNPETKTYESVDLMTAQIGIPAPANKGISCLYERVQASVCATEAEVVLAPADILALVVGEVFNDTAATAVDLAAAEQDLVHAEIIAFPCNSVVKHADGDFVVTTAESCVESVNGDKLNLMQGGTAILGDSRPNDDRPIVLDETVTVPVGSAVRFCFDVKLYLDAAGNPTPSPYATAKEG